MIPFDEFLNEMISDEKFFTLHQTYILIVNLFAAGWSSLVARQAHNLKVAGSNPAPAPNSNHQSILKENYFSLTRSLGL